MNFVGGCMKEKQKKFYSEFKGKVVLGAFAIVFTVSELT